MRSELIIFILVMVANGAIALWKKRKEAQAAAEERMKASGGMRAPTGTSIEPPRRPAPATPRVASRAPDAPLRAAPRPEAPRSSATASPRPPRRRQDAPTAKPAAVRAPMPAPARPVAPAVPAMVIPRPTPAAAVAARRTVLAPTDPRALLRDRTALRQAFLLREILGPPRGDQPLA
jgi:hypothetical protein